MLRSDVRGIPTGSMDVDGSPLDFRGGRVIGATKVDNAFTDFERDAQGRVHVRLTDPGSGSELTLWADAAYAYLMVFTGDTLRVGARRALAVEPMTCPPNAFQTGQSVVRLAPGESHRSSWGITPALR
jgi:aldose 1-epimerase